MSEAPANGPTFEGQDDYIRDAGLDAVDRLYEAMPNGWEITNMQGHTKSVTLTVRFDGIADPQGQCDAAERVFMAAQVIGTLARNLRWEREWAAAYRKPKP